MENLILTTVSLENFKSIVKESVKAEFDNVNLSPPNQEEDNLLKIEEVQDLLSVSKVTIHKWKKKGILPYYKLNRRLYFKKSEILAALRSSAKLEGR
ncbi:MAG: helix-turn-helix domain-containing protein [Bacteroidetes bacterium]|nr:helix-turn-helix domain-containing protein [Bacteroidota bacterium]